MTQGEKLRQIRKSKKLSAKVVGSKINISQAYLSKIENDLVIPSNQVLYSLLDFYDLSLLQFLNQLDDSRATIEYTELINEAKHLTAEQQHYFTLFMKSLKLQQKK